MEEFWEKVRKEALEGMREVLKRDDIEDTCEDMGKALEYAFKHCTWKMGAQAVQCYTAYKWAALEKAAHAAKAPAPAAR